MAEALEELDQLISSNTYKPSIRLGKSKSCNNGRCDFLLTISFSFLFLALRIAAARDTLHVALGEVRDKSNELIRNLYTASDCLKLDEAEEEDDDDNYVRQEES